MLPCWQQAAAGKRPATIKEKFHLVLLVPQEPQPEQAVPSLCCREKTCPVSFPENRVGCMEQKRTSAVHAATGRDLPPQKRVLVPVGWSSRKRLQDCLCGAHHHCCPWQHINRCIHLIGTVSSFCDTGMCPSVYCHPASSMCLFMKKGLKKLCWHMLLLQQAAAISGLVQWQHTLEMALTEETGKKCKCSSGFCTGV